LRFQHRRTLETYAMSEGTPQILLIEEDPTLLEITAFRLDGIEFINRLSNDVRTSEIPIMILSTKADLDDVQRAYNAGADEYLVIPYDPMVLESKVERLAHAMVANTH
jgi:response regulator RpfG family c-di-GMP phosphodiesterase